MAAGMQDFRGQIRQNLLFSPAEHHRMQQIRKLSLAGIAAAAAAWIIYANYLR